MTARHHVALTVVGTDRWPQNGYFRAKLAQEKLIRDTGIAYSLVHATQFFEFVASIADSATEGTTVRLPHALVQPIAAADVATTAARTAAGAPIDGHIEIAGPDQFGPDEWIRRGLAFHDDPREVVTDPDALYFGAHPGEGTLVPGDGAQLATTRFEDWLRTG